MRKSHLLFIIVVVFLLGCQSTQSKKAFSSAAPIKSRDQLYQENIELQLKNAVLLKAIGKNHSKNSNKNSVSKQNQPFAQFDTLISEQAHDAFAQKDLDRLSEAFRILKSQSPKSVFLPKIYILLSELQIQNRKLNLAIITLDEFIRSYPNEKLLPRAYLLKAKLYEKLNLNIQALEVYKSVEKMYPHAPETLVARRSIMEIKK